MILAGECDLPDKTALLGSIWFEDQERIETRSHQTVKKGKFIFSYGPFVGLLPAGKYVWKVQSDSFAKYTCFPHEKVYYHRSFQQKQSEIRAEMLFWQKWLEEIQVYQDSLKKSYLEICQEKNKNNLEKIRQHIQDAYSDFRRLENQIKQKQDVFPRFPEPLWKATSILQTISQYLDTTALRIFLYFSMPIEKNFSELLKKIPDPVSQTLELKKLEAKTSGEISSLHKSLPLPSNLKEKELQEDLLWLNEIFKNLTTEYNQSQKKFYKEQWQIAMKAWQEEIENYGFRIQDYSLSPLALQYPELLEDLKTLHENIKNIAILYNEDIYRKAKLPLPGARKASATIEKSLEALRSTMQKLLKQLEQQKSQEEYAREKAWKEMHKGIALLTTLQEDLQKGLQISKTQDFILWRSQYKKSQEQASAYFQKARPFFKDLYVLCNRNLVWIDSRLDFHKKILEGTISQEDQKIKIHIKKVDMQIQMLLLHIQKEAEKPK